MRSLTDAERVRREAGLRSSDTFVLRRCQILLASARGERSPRIAPALGCDDPTGREVMRRREAVGVERCLTRQSHRPHQPKTKRDAAAAEKLRALLHQRPRLFGKPTSVWTLALAAEVSFADGITAERGSDETVRVALHRLEVSWKRTKRWISSPDPEDARNNVPATV